MRNFRSLFRYCMGISIFLFLTLVIIHLKGGDLSQEGSFWTNIILSVFGSFLAAGATAFMSYWEDRRRTLESFSLNTKKILHILRKYDFDWNEDRKIQFFRDFIEQDRDAWHTAYADICFISEGKAPNADHEYIYKSLYVPIWELVKEIESFIMDLKVGDIALLNNPEKEQHLKTIENILAPHKEFDTEFEKGKITHCSYQMDSLTVSILKELNGRYYGILYPGKKYS